MAEWERRGRPQEIYRGEPFVEYFHAAIGSVLIPLKVERAIQEIAEQRIAELEALLAGERAFVQALRDYMRDARDYLKSGNEREFDYAIDSAIDELEAALALTPQQALTEEEA